MIKKKKKKNQLYKIPERNAHSWSSTEEMAWFQ